MNKWDELKSLSSVAYNYLSSFDPNIKDGRYELGEGVYINIESYKTQYRSERKFEAHKKYIDVQYMITGTELITVSAIEELTCIKDYDNENDIMFFESCALGVDFLLSENDFIILRPEDAHMPCICVNERKDVRKAIIKIPVTYSD